jgi:hypothetical protein
VEFSVDDEYSRNQVDPPSSRAGLAIADHVKRVVKSFIHHHEPKSLFFEPSDNDRKLMSTKDVLYQRSLLRLGAKSIEPHPKHIGVHIAHFKEHFQEFLDTLMEDAPRKPLNGASRRFGVSKKNPKKDLKEEIDKSEFQGIGTAKVGHHSTVHGHRVLVGFQKHPDRNEYEVDFHVNGQISKSITSPVPTEHGLAIADHVRKVVKSFVHHQKPDSLSFQAADRNRDVSNAKHELYMRGLKKLGATSVERHPQYQGNHIAHFKEHFQEFLDTLMEDAPTNSTGPAIAGMSAQSEPGVKKSRQRSLQNKNAQDAETRDGFTKVWRRKALPVMEMKKPKWEVPAEPGSTTVPADHVRLYHQTDGTNMSSIRRHGIRLSKAKGIEGPRAIYADEKGFYGKPHIVPSVEFHVHKSEYHAPFVKRVVVEPDKIVATHKTWHDSVRYIDADSKLRKDVEDGKHDRILKDKGSRESKAVRFVKKRAKADLKEAVEVKRGKFAGNDTFVVPSHVYHEAVHHKAKGAHWTKYLNETEYGTAIREFANNNPHKPIVLEDEKTGYLTYARYGNTNKR